MNVTEFLFLRQRFLRSPQRLRRVWDWSCCSCSILLSQSPFQFWILCSVWFSGRMGVLIFFPFWFNCIYRNLRSLLGEKGRHLLLKWKRNFVKPRLHWWMKLLLVSFIGLTLSNYNVDFWFLLPLVRWFLQNWFTKFAGLEKFWNYQL